MRGTLAGLGASRAEVEAKFQKPWGHNEFITNFADRKSNFDYDRANGRFRWDAEKIYFEFYGQGKLRTITILWSEVQASAQLEGETFAPWAKDRWTGKLTEYVGTAHSVWNTSLWERAAWNTVNMWCTARGRQALSTIGQLRDTAAKAYARITLDYSVHYFIPKTKDDVVQWDDRPIHEKRGSMEGESYWMSTFLRHFPSQGDPSWEIPTNLTPEQRGYIMVAWDQFEESGGKSFAPLQGIDLKLRKRRKS